MKKNIYLVVILLLIFLSSCNKEPIDDNTNPIIEEQVLPSSCIDENEGSPIITFISTNSGNIDTKITIKGCNFSGFEGDKHVWIENEEGIKGLLYGEEGSTSKQINITLKSPICQFDTSYSGLECDSWLELIPGKYKIYVMPWGKVSNLVNFTIIKETKLDILTKLFQEKYPKYADTLYIKIEKETETHVRGGITFVSGQAGGYFLAAKIDGKWQIILDGNGQISCGLSKYGFPEDMLSDCSKEYQIELSYQDIINYLNYNITDIITKYSKIKPANGKWFADGFGFTSINNVYVDYEDGHFLYRALLECDNKNNIISCKPEAIFEKEKSGWKVIQGEDTQKNKEIIYKTALDYEWER